MKKVLLTIIILSFLNSCQSVSEGFKLKKKNNGDEFLVEKKNPLVLPPDYSELPTPENINSLNKNENITENDKDKFEKIINKSKNTDNSEQKVMSSSIEESILKNIKKDASN
ncbi:DUF3035 domain-containing protein [Candidatus Pelagibacter sp.]|jgi:hypothetical protein|nr:DUF3035 domain-containing protein [Candidatus Pelagibacter sp.]MDC0442442.1 DUF3035 domain-containing protein [Candidatus Pelagibacter sp.]|tara:strand:- start:344 stop:679 length:336 start_codon:yes stop_codon:yes gene_type:complete